jgi:hypothetical protein
MVGSGARRAARRRIVLVTTALLFTTVACNLCGSRTEDRVRRLTAGVWAGSPAANPPLLDHNDWTDLKQNDGVKTDASGEAELELSDCPGSLYVFTDSAIQVATCRKSQHQSGLAVCASQGSAYFNVQCTRRFTVYTSSGQVTIQGTALSVIYLPDQRLTLVVMLDGKADVEPVTDWQRGTTGEAIALGTGRFLWTWPDGEPTEIGGVPQREPVPVEELRILGEALAIEPWLETIGARARQEGIMPETWPSFGQEDTRPAVAVQLAADGGPLGNVDVQEALLAAIDKDSVAEQAFPDQKMEFLARVAGQTIDARSIAYDSGKAQEILGRAGYPYGFGATLLFPAGDDQLGRMAEAISAYLNKIGIDTGPVAMPPKDFEIRIDTMVEAGEAILWLQRR